MKTDTLKKHLFYNLISKEDEDLTDNEVEVLYLLSKEDVIKKALSNIRGRGF